MHAQTSRDGQTDNTRRLAVVQSDRVKRTNLIPVYIAQASCGLAHEPRGLVRLLRYYNGRFLTDTNRSCSIAGPFKCSVWLLVPYLRPKFAGQ